MKSLARQVAGFALQTGKVLGCALCSSAGLLGGLKAISSNEVGWWGGSSVMNPFPWLSGEGKLIQGC